MVLGNVLERDHWISRRDLPNTVHSRENRRIQVRKKKGGVI